MPTRWEQTATSDLDDVDIRFFNRDFLDPVISDQPIIPDANRNSDRISNTASTDGGGIDGQPADAEVLQTRESPETWLDLHGDYLFRFASMRVQNVHIAEDLVQDALVNAFKAFSKFRGDSSIRTWLVQILRNEISRHFRHQAQEKSMQASGTVRGDSTDLGSLLNPKIDVGQFQSAVEREEFWVVIQECFEKTPEHLLETFLLRLANENENIENLCKQLDINASNFSVRLFRTRLLLRECVEKNWLDMQ